MPSEVGEAVRALLGLAVRQAGELDERMGVVVGQRILERGGPLGVALANCHAPDTSGLEATPLCVPLKRNLWLAQVSRETDR